MTETTTQQKVDAPIEMAQPRMPGREVAPKPEKRSAAVEGGEFSPANLRDAMEFAQLMAQSGPMVPPHCRDAPAVCLGILMRSMHWKADPFAVADKSYLVKRGKKKKQGGGEEEDTNDVGRIAYEASLIHAVIQKFGNLIGDLETTYSGEIKPSSTQGEFVDERRIKVKGKYVQNGVVVEREYESPPVYKIGVKNSPLWQADLEQQLHYYGTRAWARRWRPGVILGVYTVEEIEEAPEMVSDADRALAIEYRPDPLNDDDMEDPNAPLPGAPLAHRMSYALEQVLTDPAQKGALQAVFMRFQDEIEATAKEPREKLRGLYALHLRRVMGEIAHDEAMAFSRAIREAETS